MNKEIWKDIAGYEELYQVSNLGRIKRILFKNGKYEFAKEKILKNVLTKDYYHITLSKNNKKQIYMVHKLVAKAFLDEEKNKDYINHKDGNKLNNNVENLEWCTLSENTNHAYKNGLMKRYKEKYEKMKKQVGQYTLDGTLITKYESIRDASRKTKIDSANISKSCKNLNRNAGGYKWKFII